jgi:hypothetical protein
LFLITALRLVVSAARELLNKSGVAKVTGAVRSALRRYPKGIPIGEVRGGLTS